MASGEMGGTLPGTATLINLLDRRKNLPENDSILHFIKNMIGGNGNPSFHILVILEHFVDVPGESFLF